MTPHKEFLCIYTYTIQPSHSCFPPLFIPLHWLFFSSSSPKERFAHLGQQGNKQAAASHSQQKTDVWTKGLTRQKMAMAQFNRI